MNSKTPTKVKQAASAKRIGDLRVMREIKRIMDDDGITQEQALWQIKRALSGKEGGA